MRIEYIYKYEKDLFVSLFPLHSSSIGYPNKTVERGSIIEINDILLFFVTGKPLFLSMDSL